MVLASGFFAHQGILELIPVMLAAGLGAIWPGTTSAFCSVLGVADIYNGDYILSEYKRLNYADKILAKEREVCKAQRENFCRWSDRVGSVTPGKYADLVAVDGDPLADISCGSE